MPELIFKGKEFVYNHHLAVPHRPLVPHADKSIGDVRLDGNLIIHGDNLEALKALLPIYAGKVDCVFIDPPYNTGNEDWSYNDNVNSPMMKEWLNSNPVGIEDGLRHDKWLAMMYPRLRLLHELLSDAGSFWMTLDDNEIHRARAIMDEIFGDENFIECITWQKKVSPSNDAQWFSSDHDYILVYAKDKSYWRPNRQELSEKQKTSFYKNPDNDPRGDWNSATYTCNKSMDERPNLYYPIKNPFTNEEVFPKKTAVWAYSKEQCQKHQNEGLLYWGASGNATTPRFKNFLTGAGKVVPRTVWGYNEVGHTQEASQELSGIYPENNFATPKPTRLIKKILDLATNSDSIVLDSFAGSGTTAHAVLNANNRDGGNRRFILIEGENYANTLTAERVRRVIQGYAFKGTQREELMRESLTFTSLKKSDKLLDHVASIENLRKHDFDNISKTVKDGVLIVSGEKTIEDHAEGLGGSFTYCTLGAAVDMDKLLTGETLPDFMALGSVLFHMATNEAFDPATASEKDGHGYLGETSTYHVWLIYKNDLDFLKSREAALTLSKAESLVKSKPGKRHLVFAPARFVSQKLLDEAKLPVEFAPLPFALYRVERS
jgi:adenine-specific DNA-methyltransferase